MIDNQTSALSRITTKHYHLECLEMELACKCHLLRRLLSVHTLLRLLRRYAPHDSVLVKVYCTCVRPIPEYPCEVWHSNLPVDISNHVEKIQIQTQIIFPSLTYDQAMLTANVPSLNDRRSTFVIDFYTQYA